MEKRTPHTIVTGQKYLRCVLQNAQNVDVSRTIFWTDGAADPVALIADIVEIACGECLKVFD